MPLPDDHPSVVDGLGQAQLEHLRLQPPLQKVCRRERQDVIQLALLLLVKEAVPVHTTQ